MAIQGFGNVGSHAALLLQQAGAKISAVSDVSGGVSRAERRFSPLGRAEALRAEVVIEAANAPTTAEGDEVLQRRGIPTLPDILVNAGGATVSYVEWVRNVQRFRWDGERVDSELRALMTKACRDVSQLVKFRRLSWPAASYVLALERVAEAPPMRGAQWSYKIYRDKSSSFTMASSLSLT